MFKIRKPILSHAHAPRPRPFYPTYDGRDGVFRLPMVGPVPNNLE